jgi:hypothetical protein
VESPFLSLTGGAFFFGGFVIVFLDDLDAADFLGLAFLEGLWKGEGEERSLIALGRVEALC